MIIKKIIFYFEKIIGYFLMLFMALGVILAILWFVTLGQFIDINFQGKPNDK